MEDQSAIAMRVLTEKVATLEGENNALKAALAQERAKRFADVPADAITKMEMLTVRFLGWLGEKLAFTANSGQCSMSVLNEIEQCCDRVEHIAQYSGEGLYWEARANNLRDDIRFMEAALKNRPDLARQIGHQPSSQDLENLDAMIVAAGFPSEDLSLGG